VSVVPKEAEFLVYRPSESNPITVDLSVSQEFFNVEWFNSATGTTSTSDPAPGGGHGEAVLYLKDRLTSRLEQKRVGGVWR
jgi:hypothetical protein